MKKKIILNVGIPLFIIVLIALAGMYKFNFLANKPGHDVDGNKVEETDPKNDFEIIEVLGQNCQVNSDCEIPFNYAIQSNCPYDSMCIKNNCTVVCPIPFTDVSAGLE